MTPKDIQGADALGNITISQPAKIVPISDLRDGLNTAQQQVDNAQSEVSHLTGRVAAATEVLAAAQADYDGKKEIVDAATTVAVAAGFSAQADTL